MPDDTAIWRDLLVAWRSDEVDEPPLAYAQRRHDERYRVGE